MKAALYPLHCLEWPTEDVEYPIEIGRGAWLIDEPIELSDIQKIGMSEEDVHHIQCTPILKIDEEIWNAKQMSLLFMIGCRVNLKCTVFIWYRINQGRDIAKIRDDYYSYGHVSTLSIDELKKSWKYAENLKKLSDSSFRAQNAIYFLKEAYLSQNSNNAILQFITSLETLSSGSEREGGVEKLFKERMKYFADVDVKDLYELRSLIVHGRYSIEDEETNIEKAKAAENIATIVYRKLLDDLTLIEAFKNESKRKNLWANKRLAGSAVISAVVRSSR